jgi:hypothetical protein
MGLSCRYLRAVGTHTKVRPNHKYGELRGRHLRRYLETSPYTPIYIQQVENWITHGKLVPITLEELRQTEILYNELTHHAVQQPGKVNFPIRVVINGNSKHPGGTHLMTGLTLVLTCCLLFPLFFFLYETGNTSSRQISRRPSFRSS